jgi:iron complex outermembrane receptor protein
MDMIEDDSWHIGLRYKTVIGVGTLDTYLYMHDIEHLMTNHTLRPAMMRMNAPASSRDYGLRSEYSIPLEKDEKSTFRVGIDIHRNEFDADQVMLSTGAVRDTFADNQRDRFGVFTEWEKQWCKEWSSLLGLRGDLVETCASKVRHGFGMPPVVADAAAFNAGKRSHDDFVIDLVAALQFEPNDVSLYELAFAMKNRAPSLAERYLWTPLNASSGRADGRSYMGNTELDPETSFQISASAARKGENWKVKLTPFYNYIEDYIQGLPMARNDRNGRPVLQFQNIDHVELYGAELAARYEFTDELSLSGHTSYVRGKNTSNGDNLYRIAPLNGLVDLAWESKQWEFHCELEWAADQNSTSAFNGESPTAGYALVHLRAAHEFKNGPRVEVGIENLLDEKYSDHLGGVNRVGGSDVGIGQRIPGAGRFAYLNMSWSF